MNDRYFDLIDEIIQLTLKGKISSKEQIYQMLVQTINPGTGEIFESCLDAREKSFQEQESQNDELKQAKAIRSLRAIKTIKGEWIRAQAQTRTQDAIATAVQQIISSPPNDQLLALLRAIDPNQTQALTRQQQLQLANTLTSIAPNSDVQQLAVGLTRGVQSWQHLEGHLVSWIYDQGQEIGFGGTPGQTGPWAAWEKQVNSPFLKALFNTLSLDQSVVEVTEKANLEIADWVELVIVLQGLQQGLVNWFDQRIYSSQMGAKLSISTFLTFAVIWSLLGNGLRENSRFAQGCFQVTLQILRTFAQQPYFPLYGGVFASFSGSYLRDTLDYLDEPLRQGEGTQEKARILTLLGYSFSAQGEYERAIAFLNQALEIARQAADFTCEIACLNHLSRTYVAQKNYTEAINYSQRALILSRQKGDRPGEANALSNLGYSEVFSAQQLEQADPEIYESAINYLEQGLALSERLGEGQSQALCLSSLGIANVVLEQPNQAIAYLEKGIQTAQFSGDLYLQGLNLAYLAEAHYKLNNPAQTVLAAYLGMYLLEQAIAKEWRQPAGLITILQGQIGVNEVQKLLQQSRPQIIAFIGVDGYDYLPQLLVRYQQSD